ncbi:MAG: tRNA nucleotidyltransferase [Slackia sp.]|nr:tRNA nucleotidyltransferase [Slackia sp.]
MGGCVRDALIGRCAHDFDIATSARWDRVVALFSSRGCRVVEAGSAHGSVGVIYDELLVEVTTYRIEAAYGDKRRPDSVSFVDDIELDLARRDFCMNAIAYHPERGILDPFGGTEDIAEQRIRAVGDPALRFMEDPLRIMRALRFCSQLGFSLDEATDKALVECAAELNDVAKERVFSELSKLICSPYEEKVLARYANVLETVLEGIEALAKQPSPFKNTCKNMLEHAAHVVACVPEDAALRFAALFSHMAPHAEQNRKDECHAAVFARQRLRALKAPRKLIERVCALVANRSALVEPDRLGVSLLVAANNGDVRFVRDLLTLKIAQAAACGEREREYELRHASEILDELVANRKPLSRSELALSGNDLIAAGMTPGPSIAAMLDALLLEVIRETVANERTALLELASRIEPPTEGKAGNIFEKILKIRLTENPERSNIQIRA